MIAITIIHVGDFKEKYFSQAFEEYAKRISSSSKLEVVSIKEENLGEENSQAIISRALEREGKAILDALDTRSFKVALCVEGRSMSSEELAELFEKCAGEGRSKITFIIGSSYGLDRAVKDMCDLKLSFSKMTFPHQLMRVILAEQCYRAQAIISGKKYHK